MFGPGVVDMLVDGLGVERGRGVVPFQTERPARARVGSILGWYSRGLWIGW